MAKHTRFGPSVPVQIFQDDFFNHSHSQSHNHDHTAPMISHAPMPPASKAAPRRPLQPNNANNLVFNPPASFAMPMKQSPFKSTAHTSSNPLTPLKATQSGRLNTVSIVPPCNQGQAQATDSIPKKQPLMSRFKTGAQKLIAPGHARANMGKENCHPILYPAPPALNLSIENFYQKATGKRLLDAPTIKDGRPHKRLRLEDSPLPPHDSFPPIVDDGSKPGHSYAMLIGMAILRSPQRRLTLSQIYKWISDNFSFYHPTDAGWQNSIRHNLSLNKNFIKHERPKDDPGKGSYWAIEPGAEHTFMKEKSTRGKSMSISENMPVMSTVLEPSLSSAVPTAVGTTAIATATATAVATAMATETAALAAAIKPEPPLPMQAPSSQPTLPNLSALQQPQTGLQLEPSSDATIPVSDNVALEEPVEKTVETESVLESRQLYSPLPAAMHSSPPIPRHLEAHGNTPPPLRRRSSSSAAKSHKRKFASMDDSGYISSLDSSVLRSNQNPRLPPADADRPRIKRGRAEEEIARLRASSYDSPTKGRSWVGFAPPSSSPLRHGSRNDGAQMRPPVTPAIKLVPPPRPPPSVSPNTNLRLHRAKVQSMMDSPLRRITDIPEEEDPWGTPLGLNFDQSIYNFDLGVDGGLGDIGFDIFQDSSVASLFPAVEKGSPQKRSAKRPRLERPHSTSALGDITNSSSRRSVTSAPFLKMPRSPAVGLDTPSKVFSSHDLPSSPSKLFLQSPSKLPSSLDAENAWLNLDEFCSTDFLEETSDFAGVDIMQGFDRIGQSARNSRSTMKPGLGRSYTSSF